MIPIGASTIRTATNPKTGNSRGPQKRRPYGNHRALQTDQFNILRGLIEQLVMHQEHHLDQAERAGTALERQAAALEVIAAGLARMSGAGAAPVVPAQEEEPAPTGAPAGAIDTAEYDQQPEALPEEAPETQKLPREQLLSMIRQMREKELSYEKIADAFNDRGIATLSGKGIWRGQTIYRLFHHG